MENLVIDFNWIPNEFSDRLIDAVTRVHRSIDTRYSSFSLSIL